MVCKNCGAQLTEGSVFCSACGAQISSQSTTADSLTHPELPMGWFNFIVRFLLFALAVLNLISSVMYISGSHYAGARSLVYAFFPTMRILDIFMAIVSLLLVPYILITRSQLAKFRKLGPPLMLLLPVLKIMVTVVYTVLSISSTSELFSASEVVDFKTLILGIIINMLFEIINVIYFSKRQHLFVN